MIYVACGIGFFLLMGFFALLFIKARGANSNYHEFSIDDVPVETLWRKDYE